MKRQILLAAAATFIAGNALAADLVVVEPAPVFEAAPVILNWTGVYFGLQGGYGGDWFDQDNLDLGGFVGGGHVGYLHQFQNGFVLGAEGDVEYSGMDGSESANGRLFGVPIRARVGRDIDVLASARLKAGFAYGNFLAYATGGYAYAHTSADANIISGGAQIFRTSRDEGRHGYTIGGGAEALVTEKISVGLEYRWTDLQDTKLTFGPGVSDVKINNDFHAIRARLSYHF
ncbi:outer membrane beta-barrel protein [Acuticoccus sp. MNP-M23]|uniref:outer membrane protein n=1 Tax=Acuticoccus sp. MNP-M23 TaxID=3072793 RepID=UPI0028155D13|nr:outer membrane beta-barrel protein [Acuticoccus sp. MNP-M23]WMS40756.1 outer membrane beta-barrel protein [Acuticoccus sp. MNP-M23]